MQTNNKKKRHLSEQFSRVYIYLRFVQEVSRALSSKVVHGQSVSLTVEPEIMDSTAGGVNVYTLIHNSPCI